MYSFSTNGVFKKMEYFVEKVLSLFSNNNLCFPPLSRSFAVGIAPLEKICNIPTMLRLKPLLQQINVNLPEVNRIPQ